MNPEDTEKLNQEHDKENGPEVSITVDGKPFEIHRGHEAVAKIKLLGSVPTAYDLEQVIDKKLIPLDDNGSVTIKGNEIFVSHPKDSSSS